MSALSDRFWAKVDIRGSDECWEWQGALTRGYGRLKRGDGTKKLAYSHRVAYELKNGPIPEGMLICHKCDNRPCCNPAHLFIGTQMDNVRDMINKGRRAETLFDTKEIVERIRGENAWNSKLTEANVIDARKRVACGEPCSVLAKELSVSKQCIEKVVYRMSWKHVA